MKGVEQIANTLVRKIAGETLILEPMGKSGIRVRSTLNREIMELPGAFIEVADTCGQVEMSEEKACLRNGKLEAELYPDGHIVFRNAQTQEILLEESRVKRRIPDHYKKSRQYHHVAVENYQTQLLLQAYAGEKIFGLGQQQDRVLDHKGKVYDLFHHNTIFYVPFILSNRKYGFLWNHPGVGRVEFADNHTRWEADSAKQIDYWVTAGEDYAEILENYTSVTGKCPMLPAWAAGYWQCKLRYKTQQEVLETVREYKKRGLPLDVFVIDFFHWHHLGDWKFDPRDWPDVKAMVRELDSLGVKVMVSFWPFVSHRGENYKELAEKGYLLRTNKGHHMHRSLYDTWEDFGKGSSAIYYVDPTNPDARKFLWEKIKQNYYDLGIKLFWLDTDEPTLLHNDFSDLKYHIGSGEEVTGLFPNMHAKGFYDGLRAQGEEEIVLLSRAGWAGIQRYGALIWSGDVEATFEALQDQVVAGIQVGMSGIPWWTTDIGGHIHDYKDDEYFHELLVRWFQFGAFSPVMRNHGKRDPNEVWSFGEENYRIFSRYLHLRESLKPYLLEQMRKASETGTPVMRALFFDYPSDPETYNIKDQYLLGDDILVAPILENKARRRKVYLPKGEAWQCVGTGKLYGGGTEVAVEAPIEYIPLFVRSGKPVFAVLHAGMHAAAEGEI